MNIFYGGLESAAARGGGRWRMRFQDLCTEMIKFNWTTTNAPAGKVPGASLPQLNPLYTKYAVVR